MIRTLIPAEIDLYVTDDPVRPHITADFRHTHGRQVWGLFEDKYAAYDEPLEKPRAIICVAYTNQVPTNEHELEWFSTATGTGAVSTTTAVFYTVWSYDRGAGREVVNTVAEWIRDNRPVSKWVTLSPLTDMAEKFHTRNGAVKHSVYDTCQVFDYTHALIGEE